jgi:hypothetical protein
MTATKIVFVRRTDVPAALSYLYFQMAPGRDGAYAATCIWGTKDMAFNFDTRERAEESLRAWNIRAPTEILEL